VKKRAKIIATEFKTTMTLTHESRIAVNFEDELQLDKKETQLSS